MLGIRYVVPCFTDWQGDPLEAGNCDYDVVERGSQIMNGVADYQRDAGWELLDADSLDALLSGLEIVLDDQSCEVGEKGVILIEKFVDVALGPLGF
jgi:hypothetical protein